MKIHEFEYPSSHIECRRCHDEYPVLDTRVGLCYTCYDELQSNAEQVMAEYKNDLDVDWNELFNRE